MNQIKREGRILGVGSLQLPQIRRGSLAGAGSPKEGDDYDWLLTPPETPVFSAQEAIQHQSSKATPRSHSNGRIIATAKASRFSASQLPDNTNSVRLARSNSLTRSSTSNTYSISSYVSSNYRGSQALNTSTSSVTSRPTPPSNRSVGASPARTTPVASSRSTPSRPSTPTRTKPSPASPRENKTRPLQSFGPATPTARSQTPSNLGPKTPATRSNSRPSTPTRPSTPSRHVSASTPSPPPTMTRSASVGRVPATINRSDGHASRPSSPAARVRPPVQPLTLPDMPFDAPPNLKTKLTDRALSAGRQRPGTPSRSRAISSTDMTVPASSNRKHPSSPVVTRGMLQESSPNAQYNGTAQEAKPAVGRRSIRSPSPTECSGIGRTSSNKSTDAVLRHTDIRQSAGSVRGASVFPQSIRFGTPRVSLATASISDPALGFHVHGNGKPGKVLLQGDCTIEVTSTCNNNGTIFLNGSTAAKFPEKHSYFARASQKDVFESSRYDAILLKEDSRNTSWLHSLEEKPDQSPLFDHRFAPLPEPYGFI